MSRARRVTAVVGVGTVGMLAAAGLASAWAPAGSATIRPGVMTYTNAPSFSAGGSQCTANFVFTDAKGGVYLGQAAHCSSTSSDTSTDGCQTRSLPLGTPVYAGKDLINGGLRNGTKIGTLAYNSWLSMQARHEMNANACAYNDFALIRVDHSQVGHVNPTMPFWGGPNGLATTAAKSGSQVYSYGNSILRGGISALSPKTGLSLGDLSGSGGWSENAYTLTPGIPGDSGSGFLDSAGNALGVLSTVEFVPLPASNGIGVLAPELYYANVATHLGLRLASGTARFSALPIPPAP